MDAIPRPQDSKEIIIDKLNDKKKLYQSLKDKDTEEIIKRLENNIEIIIRYIKTIDISTLSEIIKRSKNV